MQLLALVCAGAFVFCLVLAGLLHLLPRLGSLGKALSAKCCEAPLLDVIVFGFTSLPPVVGAVMGSRLGAGTISNLAWRDVLLPSAVDSTAWAWLGGLLGIIAATIGQLVAMWAWCRLHELANPAAMKGQRIKGSLAKILGNTASARWRNYLAVWWTLWAVPIFSIIRIGELFIYPPVTWLIRLPRYRESEWVRVSRHKFDGLVGADRIWCLYCDWMTGVWSLGSEMLRNIESFWCPIRFASDAKCENCKTDFPDVDIDWVRSDGTMGDVTALIEKKYPGPDGDNSWSGHASRRATLTVKGQSIE